MLNNKLDIEKILSFVPHRYPMLLIDKVDYYDDNSIMAVKNVTFNEQFFVGHFPGKPVMPGVLIIESLAQASGLLLYLCAAPEDRNKYIYFASIDNVKFRKIVKPGDTMYLHSKIERHKRNLWKFSARAEVDGSVVTESEFSIIVVDKE
jgi:3-hydroxyacyl-[acyl-carrier-protein] dehydratase